MAKHICSGFVKYQIQLKITITLYKGLQTHRLCPMRLVIVFSFYTFCAGVWICFPMRLLLLELPLQ